MVRMFGTDGVRGIANVELTPELAFKLGKSGALVLTDGTHRPKILVAKDTRISGDMLENAMIAGILSVGAEAVRLGVVPTPAVAHSVREFKADAGVMISASHNPVEYNGIKFFDGKGLKLSDELEDEIQALIENDFNDSAILDGINIGKVSDDPFSIEKYIDFAKKTIDTDLKGLKVAIDAANGASYIAAKKVFEDLGADVFIINHEPNGLNINDNAGSTHPEGLKKFVLENKCDLGLALDGDADRCLAIDENGVLVDGDKILLISALALKEKGKLKDDTLVVTVMSNLGLDIAAKENGIKLIKTNVGDRYVLEEIIKHGYSLGGEQSGHVIFGDFNTTGDGIVTGVQLASIIKESGKSLSELAKVMKTMPQVLVNVTVSNNHKHIYDTDEDIKKAIRQIENDLGDRGRVLIRPSGTEPLVRVMIEGEDQKEIENDANLIKDLIVSKI